MTPRPVIHRGFDYSLEQPHDDATDYVLMAGVFQVRVRIPLQNSPVEPGLWVGFTAGGPLVERRSTMRYSKLAPLIEDAVMIGRILRGY